MTLHIIAKDSNPIRPLIHTICEKINFSDYFILDPKSDDVVRPFRYVLFMEDRIVGATAHKEWTIPYRLSPELPKETKTKIMQAFSHIKDVIEKEAVQKSTIANAELPSYKDLDVYLSEFKGCFLQLRMQDRRSIGIYPDGEKLKMQCDLEYHVSTLVNMCKIKDLFNPTSISIKEL